MNPNSYYAYQYYLKRGYSPQAASGITGNLMVESGRFSPDVISGQRMGDKGTAFGAAQWRGERLSNLKSYAQRNGLDYRSLDAQLGFVDHEMRTGLDGGANTAFRQLQTAKTPGDAAAAFMRHYERPHADPSINHIGLRQQYANQLYGAKVDPTMVASATPAAVPAQNAVAMATPATQAAMQAPGMAAVATPAASGIGSLATQAASALPTVASAAAQPEAADPLGGLFGLMMQARMMGASAGPTEVNSTVPRPKVMDNRPEEEKIASVSQTPDVYEAILRRRRGLRG